MSEPIPLRLGVVAYLNMQPLIHGLAAMAAGLRDEAPLTVRTGPPSQLARWLEAGEIDAGMVPVGATLVHPEWNVMAAPPQATALASMIGSRGAVRSVIVAGPRGREGWRRLRLDPQSRTSNILSQVILKQALGLELEIDPPDEATAQEIPEEPQPGVARVLIGSRALEWIERSGHGQSRAWEALDLGEEWTRWTGLPFVFALWAVRPGAPLGEWPARLEALKCVNMARIPAIAAGWERLREEGLSSDTARDYLTGNVDYDFDETAREGLLRFNRLGVEQGLVRPGWRLNLVTE